MSDVVLHEGAINRFFRATDGEMARYIRKRSTRIKAITARNMHAHFRDGGMIAGGAITAHSSPTRFVTGSGLQIKGPFTAQDGVFELVGTDTAREWKGGQFNYPIALELGGHTPQGRGYHYPMIGPAVVESGFRRIK